MKISVTDQFLWDIYNLLEKTGDAAYFVLRRRRTLYDVFPGPKNPIIEKYRKLKDKQQFSKLIYYLKRNNYIRVQNLKGREAIVLTKRGTDKAFLMSFKLGEKFQKRKDKKWIMLIFDIPQTNWKSRSLLKSILLNLGYKKFQQSVWVTPFDVYQKTERLLQYHSLDQYVRIFLVEEL